MWVIPLHPYVLNFFLFLFVEMLEFLMDLRSTQRSILTSIEGFFFNQNKKIRENIALTTYAILRCEKVNTASVARAMGEVNECDFKANDMRLYRLLGSKNFQIDDKMWRGHINLLFNMLYESTSLKKSNEKSEIVLSVDFTSDRDDFLILTASILHQGQSIPIYFSMRRYPKKTGMIDQKKMESSFFRALKHLLPKEHTYIVLADRGFGNERTLKLLESLGFQYVVRLNENLNIDDQGKRFNIKDLMHKNYRLHNVLVCSWNHRLSIVKRTKSEKKWILATNISGKNPGQLYQKRFSIEKMFKNVKSGGFDLEKLKIEKYDRFKKMLFIACIAYAIMIFSASFINNKVHHLKKNFSLHLNLLSAFSHSLNDLCNDSPTPFSGLSSSD